MDYHALNGITVCNNFLIPTIDVQFDELLGSMFFTKLDLRSGFHQIWMSDDSIEATASCTSNGHFEFNVMPFELSNAPSTFQAMMNGKFVLVFFNDILIYSPDWDSHLRHLHEVF